MDKTPMRETRAQVFKTEEGFTYVYGSALYSNHLEAIGQVATSWSLLEGMLDLAIWGFSSLTEEQGAPLTARMNDPQWIEIIGILAHQKLHDQEKQEEIRNLLRQIGTLREQRNNVIHAQWGVPDTGPEAVAMKYKFSKPEKGVWNLDISPQLLSAEDIYSIGKSILEAATRLHVFLFQNNALPPPS